jgi:hypothetical protein
MDDMHIRDNTCIYLIMIMCVGMAKPIENIGEKMETGENGKEGH